VSRGKKGKRKQGKKKETVFLRKVSKKNHKGRRRLHSVMLFPARNGGDQTNPEEGTQAELRKYRAAEKEGGKGGEGPTTKSFDRSSLVLKEKGAPRKA